jgi:orotate phosphoribosyltransferase-like protein
MSRMSELHMSIMELYDAGLNSKEIANELKIPLDIVISVFEDMNRDV